MRAEDRFMADDVAHHMHRPVDLRRVWTPQYICPEDEYELNNLALAIASAAIDDLPWSWQETSHRDDMLRLLQSRDSHEALVKIATYVTKLTGLPCAAATSIVLVD